MNRTRRRVRVAEDAAIRLARKSIRGAGALDDVARALGRSRYTVCRYGTERWHPDLKKAFEVAVLMNGQPGVSVRELEEATTELRHFSDVLMAEADTLVERGLYLMAARHRWNLDETVAAETDDPSFEEKLEREGHGQIELAAISRVLRDVHDIDLRVRYRGARS